MKTIGKSELSTPITGIGSLPHHNVDTALEYSFKMGIPFLPQIPIRNPWEFMLAQALEGLPGIQIENDGNVILHLDIWQAQSHLLDQRLKKAFEQEEFEVFEPSAAISSCWYPFLWELQERKQTLAKIQIAGPFTCQWALKLKTGESPDRYPDLSTQIYRLVLARALAMSKRLVSTGVQPLLFIDEPGLYALDPSNPKHQVALHELKLMIQTLRKQGVHVGLHCCGNTDWGSVCQLGMDYLSLDTSLSLEPALRHQNGHSLQNFLSQGGKLSLGAIPTGRSSVLHSLDPEEMTNSVKSLFTQYWKDQPSLVQKVLEDSLFTPACGLAFQSPSDAEIILEKLIEVYGYFTSH